MSNPTHYYYAADPYLLPHTILAFESENYRDKWVSCNTDYDHLSRIDSELDIRIPLTNDQAEKIMKFLPMKTERHYLDENIWIFYYDAEDVEGLE